MIVVGGVRVRFVDELQNTHHPHGLKQKKMNHFFFLFFLLDNPKIKCSQITSIGEYF